MDSRREPHAARSVADVQTVFDVHVDSGLIERALAASTFGPMWLDIPRPEYPRATGSIICDLLVVGGGYTGLWTALHAAQRNPDRRIVLVEANRIGWAASGVILWQFRHMPPDAYDSEAEEEARKPLVEG